MKPPAPVTRTLRLISAMRSSGVSLLSSACRSEHCRNGLGDDLQVEPERPLVDVLHIQFHPAVEAQLAATTDLPEAGHTRPHAEAAYQGRLGKAANISHWERTRAYQGHFPPQDIHELRNLVNRGSPQEPSDRSNPRIVFDLEHRAGGFVQMFQLGLQQLCIHDHGPELVHLEPAAIQPETILRVQYRARAGQFYRDSGTHQNG